VPQGSTPVQALNLVMAQGDFPDIIGGMGYNEETKKLMADLAAQGKILALDKYFNDAKNFPVFTQADKSYLRAYLYQGKQMAVPGYGWVINADDPWWNYGAYTWIQRYDILQKYGIPKTPAELYAAMQKVKADKVADLDGNPTIPFGWQPDVMGGILGFCTTANGSGWEVDAQKRLMPQWASQEFYNNLKFLNTLWREGMMNPGAFMIDVSKFQEDLSSYKYAFDIGSTWNISLGRDSVIRAGVDKLGKDDPKMKKAIAMQYVMMLNPVQDNPGRLTNDQVGMTFISAKNPNPDASMKLIHWMISDEGLISAFMGAGQKDVNWEYVSGPQYWQLKKEFWGPGGNQDTSKVPAGGWISATDAAKTPPMFLPVVMYLSSPSYSSYTEKLLYSRLANEVGKYGFFEGMSAGEPTVNEWGKNFCSQVQKLSVSIPSYQQVLAEIPPLEASAMATATQRESETLAKIVTAASAADFDSQYKAWIGTMTGITNWKPIYEARQKRWTDWLSANKFDDRPNLKNVTPVAEWKAVMGW